ncbi:Holliday junction branch migration protein RuvA [Adlercreutzia sp. ZJ138]|uniref:Holliday junction branch migration protein RuvA n=1 Tax=Adlercreutzia sp. ZJ138 TaxID=2709405 RepID=UPI0013E9D951|nr:Holliday junction branch migration protein RuvA [Adlercreutzia sp. ZJ138]
MIAFLNGTVAGKGSTCAYIDVAGVGYEVNMSQSALAKLPDKGNAILIHTHLQVRDDGASLFGFLSLEEKALFGKLISVSGIGPKMALAALSLYSPAQLARAISAQDVAAVQRIPGVGKKTASRIILELKGSFDQVEESLFGESDAAGGSDDADVSMRSAGEALLSMGFSSAEAELALKGAPHDADEGALVRYALKRLGSK